MWPSPAAAAGRRMTVAALADGFFIGSNCRSAAAGFLSTRGWRPPPSADAGRFMCIGLSPRAVSAAAVNRARLSSSGTGSGFQLASCCSAIAGSSALASARAAPDICAAESALPVAPESVGPSVSASGMLRAASAGRSRLVGGAMSEGRLWTVLRRHGLQHRLQTLRLRLHDLDPRLLLQRLPPKELLQQGAQNIQALRRGRCRARCRGQRRTALSWPRSAAPSCHQASAAAPLDPL